MKWLEIIELRSVGRHQALVEQELADMVAGMEPKDKPRAVNVYSHVSVETDFSVHLLHDSETIEVNGSPLGLRLVSWLKEFGLVNHSIWKESEAPRAALIGPSRREEGELR